MTRVGVTYRRGFGLDDCNYCTLYIHMTQDYRQYRVISILHTLQFTVANALGSSVFTSRILATHLSQSHCHFKSNMKPSFHSLIPFLPVSCSCQYRRQDSIQFRIPGQAGNPKLDPSLQTINSVLDSSALLHFSSDLLCPFITPRHGPHRKHCLYC
jgi:hypothetical protein